MPLLQPLLKVTSFCPTSYHLHSATERFPDRALHASGLKHFRAGLGAGATLNLSDALANQRVLLHMNVSGDRTLAPDANNPMGSLTASLAFRGLPYPDNPLASRA